MAKYNDEQVQVIQNFADKYTEEIPYGDFLKFQGEFEEEYGEDYTPRSVSSKMRHMNIALETKSSMTSVKKYNEADEAKIKEMCSDPDNLPYLEAVAEALGRDPKSVSGKLVSMGIYGVKKQFTKENYCIFEKS